MQPLDVAVFGPLKSFYNSFADAWLTTHPGRSISIYEIAELSGAAFHKAFNLENIKPKFVATVIFPLNPHVFTEDSFLPSAVTDIPNCSSAPAELSTINSSSTSCDEELLLSMQPHP